MSAPDEAAREARASAWLRWAYICDPADFAKPKARWAFDFGWAHPGMDPRDFVAPAREAFMAGRRAARAHMRATAAAQGGGE